MASIDDLIFNKDVSAIIGLIDSKPSGSYVSILGDVWNDGTKLYLEEKGIKLSSVDASNGIGAYYLENGNLLFIVGKYFNGLTVNPDGKAHNTYSNPEKMEISSTSSFQKARLQTFLDRHGAKYCNHNVVDEEKKPAESLEKSQLEYPRELMPSQEEIWQMSIEEKEDFHKEVCPYGY